MAGRIALTQTPDDLRRKTRLWWERHPMDYLGHQGFRDLSSNDSARAFFTQIDRQFQRAAWFAQAADAPLFSGLLDYAALRGCRVLEVGCGLGAISAEFARRGARVIALDLTWTAAVSTAKRFTLDRLRASAVEGDVAKLPFSNASFDFIWCWGVLPHTPDLAAAINEMRRVLRPGGELRLMIYNRHSFYNWLGIIARYGIIRLELLRHTVTELWSRYSDGRDIGGSPFVRYYSAGELRRALAGFDVLEMRAFEQKSALTALLPHGWRPIVERHIPARLMQVLFGRFGMLLFCRARKRGPDPFYAGASAGS